MNKIIGSKIKELRNNKNMTLKELSKKTGLSTGFLSQLERGLTSIATDSLFNIADALEVDLSYFLCAIKKKEKYTQKNHMREIYKIDNGLFINYIATNNPGDKIMLPKIIEILPSNNEEVLAPYTHEGEEFIYVLEGIVTLFVNDEKHDLYPGDSAHYSSTVSHNYANYTNKICKILTVSIPNYLNDNYNK